MKKEISNLVKNVGRTLHKKSPEILTGLGIASMLSSTVLAVAATPTALDKIAQKKEELDTDELTKKELLQATWKGYIPAAISGITGMACLIGATTVNGKRNAMLAAAYEVSRTTFKDYREKVVEHIGAEDEKVIREKVSQEKVNKTKMDEGSVIVTSGETLCFDELSSRYFNSDMNKIKRALNIMNNRLMNDMYVSINEFYDLIDIPTTDIGQKMGWHYEGDLLDLELSATITEDDRVCLSINFNQDPKYGYDMFD